MKNYSQCGKCGHFNHYEDKGQQMVELFCDNCHRPYDHIISRIQPNSIPNEELQMVLGMIVSNNGKPKYEEHGERTVSCFFRLNNGIEVLESATCNENVKYHLQEGKDRARDKAVAEAIRKMGIQQATKKNN